MVMVHLVLSCITYTAREVAELVFVEVYKYHGLPKSIVSNQDVLFTSTFWTHLQKLIGVDQRMSSAFHPQSDGSTERANRIVRQMLCSCIGSNQHNWVARLPSIEFTINSARSESTGYSPFFLNTGRRPRTFVWNDALVDKYPSVQIFAQKMKQAIMTAHNAILETRVEQTRTANRKWQLAPFQTGDLAYISTKNISLPRGQAQKLVSKFIGPYWINRDFGNNSFKMDLSPCLRQQGIYPVFHLFLLQVHMPNDNCLFPGQLENQVANFGESEPKWTINHIISHCGSGADANLEVRCIKRSHLGPLQRCLPPVKGVRIPGVSRRH